MKMKLMRKIDFLIGVPVCYLLAAIQIIKNILGIKPNKQGKIKKILVIKFLGIGSIALTAPALRALKDEFAEAKIYYLTFKSNKEIVELLGLTDKNFYIDTKTFYGFCKSTIQVLFKLRREKINLMIDFEFFSKLPLIIGALGRVKNKAGFYLITEWWRKYLLTFRGYYNHYYHVKDIFLSLVYLVSRNDPYYVEFESYRNKYTLPSLPRIREAEVEARQILDKSGVASGGLIIAINPNAGPELALNLKRWPAPYFVELIDRLNEKYQNISLVLIGSPSEALYVESIADRAKDKSSLVNMAGKTTLPQLVGLLAMADLFITVDSGPMHIASLTKTPTIGLFGAETPVLYGPLNDKARALCKPLYCVPMFTVYNGKESILTENIPLQLISVDEVLSVAEEYLDKHDKLCIASLAPEYLSSQSK